jgi:L-asparaginase
MTSHPRGSPAPRLIYLRAVGASARIRLLAVGGTISCLPTAAGAGAAARLTAADIVESVPDLARIAEVEVGDVATIASFAITLADMHELALEVKRALDDGCEGVVITHGTDTIEETAYALALVLARGQPVVLTGAMRNPALPGTDGPANLLAAFIAAASSETARLGPLVVLNDELHTARFAQKVHTTRLSTISSLGAGPVGEVVEGRVHVWFRPAWEDYLGLPDTLDGAPVELVRLAADPSETLLRAAIEAGPSGIVIEGTGGGHVAPGLLGALDDALAVGIPVVVATRSPSGRNLEETYGMPGSETDLLRRGVLPAGLLSGHKARLRLIVGRSLGLDPEALFPVR